MPTKPPHPCNQPGCAALTNERFCQPHAAVRQQSYERARGSAAARGYGAKWRRARAAYLAAHPLCCKCGARGIVAAATVVDHIKPHRGDMKLFWDRKNWQPLCKEHHDRKTATEDGRWG